MGVVQQALRRELLDELEWDEKLGAARLDVIVEDDGVVVITGIAESYAQKVAAERAVKRVRGVHAVVNDVDVRVPGHHEPSDTELATAVVQALERDAWAPHERIWARVSEGWVRLEGEVDRNFERSAAEKALYRLPGLRGITNLITVTERAGVACR
jgi:osmotically-inducible protein OsmY